MVWDQTKSRRKQLLPNRNRARAMRREPVQTEEIFWSLVRNRQIGGYKFKRQVPIGPFVADFVCAERKLIVELDGPFHRVADDRKRDEFLEAQGFSILRIKNEELAGDASGVIAMILNELKSLPRPRRGERAGVRGWCSERGGAGEIVGDETNLRCLSLLKRPLTQPSPPNLGERAKLI